MPQIHEQESEIVKNIGGCDLIVELDTVEQTRSARKQANVAQMKIAVTATDFTGVLACVEKQRLFG